MTDKKDILYSSNIGGFKPIPPISTIYIGGDGKHTISVGVDKKFNWFQKKMIKWCFGFEVKENNQSSTTNTTL